MTVSDRQALTHLPEKRDTRQVFAMKCGKGDISRGKGCSGILLGEDPT